MSKLDNLEEFDMDKLEAESKRWHSKWWVAVCDKAFPDGIFGYNAFHALTHPLIIIKGCINEVRWAWQRIFRGWDDRVVWGIDTYLAEMIPQWMRKLKEDKHGFPALMFGDNNWNKFSNDHFFPGTEETAVRRYELILDTIIEGFETYAKAERYRRTPEDDRKIDNAMKFFVEYFPTFWD